MKPTKTLPFVSLILIATLIAAPFIFAQEFGGSFGGFDGDSFSGGSFGGTDPSGVSGGSFGGSDPSGFSGGSFGGFDPSGLSGGSFGGTDPSGLSGGSFGGGSDGTSGGVPGGSFDGTGGSFDGGSIGFPGSGFPGGFPPGGPGFPSEHDAVWEDLADKTIHRGSASGTLIQEHVFSKCSDPDSDTLRFSIASSSDNFDLAFVADNLRIFNLSSTFVGTETVTLTCNGVPASFLLHVVDSSNPTPTPPGSEEGDEISVHIGAIIIPNAYDAAAGDIVPVTISFKNTGDKKLENLKAAVAIQDLGVRASVGPLDLSVGKRVSETVYVELPQDTQPGLYYARITLDSGSLHRVKHRDVEVIVQ